MTETKFTPGPWGLLAGCYTPENGYFWMVQVADRTTAYAFEEANAHLIAAAPDLYEALEAAANSAGFQYMWPNTRSKIEAALAKARGEA